jgi:hypothetical protein
MHLRNYQGYVRLYPYVGYRHKFTLIFTHEQTESIFRCQRLYVPLAQRLTKAEALAICYFQVIDYQLFVNPCFNYANKNFRVIHVNVTVKKYKKNE